MSLKRGRWDGGQVVSLEYESKILADNPLGDPATRRLDVWLPPGYSRGARRGKRFPVLFDLVGYTGAGPSHTNWRAFDENVPERAARLIHQRKMAPCLIVFPDCFTALGGNQYINSTAIGAYADYLTRELIPYVDSEFRTLASREHRGCFGKSSGGYGAIVHGMKYARYWGAIANHSGDAYFDFIYRSDWPNTLTELAKHRQPRNKPGAWQYPGDDMSSRDGRKSGASRSTDIEQGLDDGRVRSFLQHAWRRERLNSSEVHCLMNLCMAASYDPDPEVANGFRLPFNLETGELLTQRWRRWLQHDPIRMVRRYAGNLAKLRGVYIDCGWRDQYHIHFGCRILSQELHRAGIDHRYEEFDGTHSGIDNRMDTSLPYLSHCLAG